MDLRTKWDKQRAWLEMRRAEPKQKKKYNRLEMREQLDKKIKSLKNKVYFHFKGLNTMFPS